MCGDKDCPVMDLSKVVPQSKYSFQDVIYCQKLIKREHEDMKPEKKIG